MISLYNTFDDKFLNIPPRDLRAVDWDRHLRTLRVYTVALSVMELTEVSGDWSETFGPIASHPDFVHLNLNQRRVAVNLRDIEYITLENYLKVSIQLTPLPSKGDECLILEGSSVNVPERVVHEIDQKLLPANNIYAGRGTPLEVCIPKRFINAVKFDYTAETACIFTRTPGISFTIRSTLHELVHDLNSLYSDREFTNLYVNPDLRYSLKRDQVTQMIPMTDSSRNPEVRIVIGRIQIWVKGILGNASFMRHLEGLIEANHTDRVAHMRARADSPSPPPAETVRAPAAAAPRRLPAITEEIEEMKGRKRLR